MYSENCKILMKEIEDYTNRWKDILCSWCQRIILLKWPYHPRQSKDLIPIKISKTFFHKTRTSNPKIYTEPQKTPNCQNNPEKNKARGNKFLDFRVYYKPTVIKQHGIGTKTDTRVNGIAWRAKRNACIYGQLIYDKGGKNIQWGKDNLFNKECKKTGQLHVNQWE